MAGGVAWLVGCTLSERCRSQPYALAVSAVVQAVAVGAGFLQQKAAQGAEQRETNFRTLLAMSQLAQRTEAKSEARNLLRHVVLWRFNTQHLREEGDFETSAIFNFTLVRLARVLAGSDDFFAVDRWTTTARSVLCRWINLAKVDPNFQPDPDEIF